MDKDKIPNPNKNVTKIKQDSEDLIFLKLNTPVSFWQKLISATTKQNKALKKYASGYAPKPEKLALCASLLILFFGQK